MRRVVVTGMGALSPLGSTPHQLWDGLLASRSGIRRQRDLVDAGLPVTTGGDVPSCPRDDPARDRAMAARAIDDALAEAGIEARSAGLVWSCGLDTYQFGGDGPVHRSAADCFAALAAGFARPHRMIAVACASGTHALGEAFWLVRSGRVDRCVAGGSSVMLTPFYVIGFGGLRVLAPDAADVEPAAACRPFDRLRAGFALSDGAAALVLEAEESARARGAEPLAVVRGFGASQDAFDLNRPPPDGAGAELCVRRTLADARCEAGAVDAVNAHGTATRLGDAAEAAALRRTMPHRPPTSSPKGALGHAMAAAGALETVVSVLTAASGVVPPTVNLREPDADCDLEHVVGEPLEAGARRVLSVSFGMGGQNAGLLLERFAR